MGSSTTFLSCMGVLVFFNLVSFILGVTPTFLDIASLLITFVSLGIIIVVTSQIPFLNSGSGSVRWFLTTIIIICILFSISFNVIGYTLTVGIGLCTSLMGLGVADINNIMCLPYYFFLTIGIIALISGIMAMNSGGD